jgi:hypothetical protein
MDPTDIGTIETLLESSIEQTDDPEIKYKLRQALQLLVFVEEHHVEARQVLTDAEISGDVRENLADLGYID